MAEVLGVHDQAGLLDAGRLLHAFNLEYDDPSPPPAEVAARLAELMADGHVHALLARTPDDTPVGVAVLRLQPSLWSTGSELYLAELYVVPAHRGQGHGRDLLIAALDLGRTEGADYAFLVTSEDDLLAQRLYEAAGFRRTEGEGGPLMLAYEQDL